MLARRAQFHQNVLASNVSWQDTNLRLAVNGLATHLGPAGLERVAAVNQAYIRVYADMVRQSAALSFVDAYWLLGGASGLMFFTVFFVQRNNPKEGTGSAHVS